jgi:phage-related protein
MGYALSLAQASKKHVDAKPLKGFGGAGVLEVVEDSDGNAFRAVYTVKLAGVVYVLHAFQKKSKKGIKTSSADIDKGEGEAEGRHGNPRPAATRARRMKEE